MDVLDAKLTRASLTGTRFVNMDEASYDKYFRQSIGYACVFCGIKEAPDSLVLTGLKKVFNHYHYITPDEFQLAFELNLHGEYEKKIEHYQQFSADFMASIFQAYRSRKVAALKAFKQYEPIKELPGHNTTDEDHYNKLVEYVAEKGMPHFWNWVAVFRFMKESGKVTESLEERNELKAKVKNRLEGECLKRPVEAKGLLSEENVRYECQREYVINRFSI